MKFSKLTLLAAGAMIMASCSNDNEPVVNPITPEGTEGGYVSVALNLPTQNGTRADEYADGNAQEWAVLNGRVIVWRKAATESAASAVCVSELSGLSWNTDANAEITTTSTATARLQNINMSDANIQYMATVVLNYNDTFVFPAEGETFGTWAKKAQTNSMTLVDGGKTYLTMTQAPKFNSATAAPTSLVAIDKNKISQTEGGLSGTAATFNVERGVAKVTVSAGNFNVTGTNFSGDKVNITAWALDVTNKLTFPVQVTDGLLESYSAIWSKARFSGAENSTFRRLFWSLDPNYSKDLGTMEAVKGEFNIIGNSDVKSAPAEMYCLENTFDISHMLQGQTTRVVLKGTYTPNSIPGYTAGATFFRVGGSNKLWLKSTLEAEIKSRAATVVNSTDVSVDLGSAATTAGYYALNAITIKKGNNAISASDMDKVAKAMGLKDASDASIATYLNGECYYIARIKHFGDSETPWEIGNETYGGNNERWLGRYGVVRNTIYEVNVASVSNPGTPSVPVINPTEPDDVNDYYIQASIRILAWAKRVNNVDL